MNIKKEAVAAGRGKPTAQQLEAINAQAKAELTEEQAQFGVVGIELC